MIHFGRIPDVVRYKAVFHFTLVHFLLMKRFLKCAAFLYVLFNLHHDVTNVITFCKPNFNKMSKFFFAFIKVLYIFENEICITFHCCKICAGFIASNYIYFPPDNTYQ